MDCLVSNTARMRPCFDSIVTTYYGLVNQICVELCFLYHVANRNICELDSRVFNILVYIFEVHTMARLSIEDLPEKAFLEMFTQGSDEESLMGSDW